MCAHDIERVNITRAGGRTPAGHPVHDAYPLPRTVARQCCAAPFRARRAPASGGAAGEPRSCGVRPRGRPSLSSLDSVLNSASSWPGRSGDVTIFSDFRRQPPASVSGRGTIDSCNAISHTWVRVREDGWEKGERWKEKKKGPWPAFSVGRNGNRLGLFRRTVKLL